MANTKSAKKATRVAARRSVTNKNRLSRVRSSSSSPFSVKVMQVVGQMSTHASHSMHRLVVKTVWTSQLRHRCAS